MTGRVLRRAIVTGRRRVSEMDREACLGMLAHSWPCAAQARRFKPAIWTRLSKLEGLR